MSELRLGVWNMPAAALGEENPLAALPSQQPPAPPRVDPNVSAEDRKMFGRGSVRSPLPYRLRDGYDRVRLPRTFKTAVLENDVLRATFLLELGGRLWSLLHKPSGRELLSINPVFQPANLAVRNAWFSGGVEWNCGIPSHTPLTCEPMFAARVPGEDGQPILRIYEWERVRGLPYQMDFSLPDGSQFLLARMRVTNPHDQDTWMYWWSNAAVPLSPDLRVLVPADTALCTHYKHGISQANVPIHGGLDGSYPARNHRAMDYFYRIPLTRRKWEAGLYADGAGLVQTSTSLLRGRKLFVWGNSPGGHRWQEFLSDGSQRYVELQAGLGQTQYECVPMPAGAAWEWMEAYGLLQADPAIVHATDWAAAQRNVENRLEGMLPSQWMEDHLRRTAPSAHRPPGEMLNLGSGWGALELRRLEKAGCKPFCGPGMVFPQESLGKDQAQWLALLETGEMPSCPIDHEPGTYMIQGQWQELLSRALSAGRGSHWLSWLHMGIIHYADGRVDQAQVAWMQSVSMAPSAWAYRNLAQLHRDQARNDEALEMYQKACALLPKLAPLAVEYCRAFLTLGKFAELKCLGQSLPPAVRGNARIELLLAIADLELGDLQEIQRLLSKDVILPDLREGERALTDLWFALHEKRISAAENKPIDDALRRRVQQDFPPPGPIDFRMFVDND